MRPKKRFWRWRSNPLRRPSDVLEAAVLLVVAVLVAVGGPIAGFLAGGAALDIFRAQRQERYPATAFLVADAPGRTTGAFYSSGGADTVRVTVRWRDARDAPHVGSTRAEPGRKAGSALPVWLDGRGRLTHEPLAPADAAAAAALVGVLAAMGWCATALATVHAVRLYLNRRRSRQWDREWAQDGPLRGHKRI